MKMPQRLSRRQFIKQGKATLIGVSALSLLGLVCDHVSSQFKTNSTDKLFVDLEKQIPELMRKTIVPGASIAVIKDGQIVWSRGFGIKNANNKQPVDTSTVFAAASLSKPVFAYAVLKMCERGELNLDTPLTEYTDKRIVSDPRLKQITTRMILSHSSGFTDVDDDPPVTISSPPGTRFRYSSEGYFYLQGILEHIAGQALNDIILRNVFTPLGMTSSSYVWMKQYESLAANGHDRQGNAQPIRRPSHASSAGSLRTTATDFAKFLAAIMQANAEDAFRLSENSLSQMLRPQIKINGSLSWGLGWGLEQNPGSDFFWHWGDLGIYKSFALASRKLKTGIVILTNSANGLKMCKAITDKAIGGQHPAFSFSMINY